MRQGTNIIMSTDTNTTFLEQKFADFQEADYETKLEIIRQLKDNGFSTEAREMRFEMRDEWLKDYGVTFTDILSDDDGEEYIMSEYDTGHPSDVGYESGFKRINLPSGIQNV